jgi:hypothetical protein
MRNAREVGRIGALLIVLSTTLSARAASPPEAGLPQPVLGVAALGGVAGAGLALEGRLRVASGVQVGIGVTSQALRVAHIGGYAVRGVSGNEVRLLALFPLLESQGFELDLRLATGLIYLHDVGTLESPYRHALRSSTEVACLAHVRLGDHNVLRAGVILGFDLETEPTTSLADQSQLLSVGFGRALGPSTLLYASVEGGGTYGFNGDNGKAVLRGSLGLRFALGGDARMAF